MTPGFFAPLVYDDRTKMDEITGRGHLPERRQIRTENKTWNAATIWETKAFTGE